MILLFSLLAAAQGTALPLSITEPYFEYNSCLLDNPKLKESWKKPLAPAERPKLVDRILANCETVRVRARPIMEARLKSAAPDADASGQVKMLFDTADDRIRMMVVDREKFVKLTEDYEKCLDEKGLDQC